MKKSQITKKYPSLHSKGRAIKRMNRHKAEGLDGITCDIIKLLGQIVLTYLTNIFNITLRTNQIPDSWHEAKTIILFKREKYLRRQKSRKESMSTEKILVI